MTVARRTPVAGRLVPLLLLALQAALAYRSWSHYRRWPRLPDAAPDAVSSHREPEAMPPSDMRPSGEAPTAPGAPSSTTASSSTTAPSPHPALPSGDSAPLSVSIVVPARDEADNLMRLLPSLICLDPPPREIVVVNDRSTDDTATIAARFGMRVLHTTEPPAGWSGKNWACQLGADRTRGDWLLFTDADTWHAPASLGAALAAATRDGAELLSIFPAQECSSLAERLVLPFAFGQFFAAIGPAWANDDSAPSAVANGQYLLVRRAIYERLGGHAAVRASLGEDVELARLARRDGVRVRSYRGEHLARVRMYRTFGGIQTGFRKYMAGYLKAYPPNGAIIGLATALAGLPLIRIVEALAGRTTWGLALASYAVGVVGFAPWVRWFGGHPLWALLQPVAYGAFQAVALDAGLRSLLGVRVTWKGRRYRA